ncbi:MAG: lamin tail domain-containing protein [Anaerolineae bacterium]|nr:lamin tail domain-containing protein [Anaerolineae bacterium]
MHKKYAFTVLLTLALLLVVIQPALAADTTAVLDGGVCINEVLIDPTGSTYNFDTDGNGTASATDEFVELYNLSASAIDISGWELWDAGVNNWYTFQGAVDSGTTMLQPNAYAVVVIGVQSGGSLPTMTNPASLSFDAGRGSAVMNDGGDNVVLYDPGADQYIQLLYNGDAVDDPPTTYSGFSATATRVGSAEDWGNDEDGISLTHSPSGDTNVVQHNSTYGSGASPNAVILTNTSAQAPTRTFWAALAAAGLLIYTASKRRRSKDVA